MYFEYYVKQNNKWHRVDFNTYIEFEGEKERRPSTWRTVLLQTMLGGVK